MAFKNTDCWATLPDSVIQEVWRGPKNWHFYQLMLLVWGLFGDPTPSARLSSNKSLKKTWANTGSMGHSHVKALLRPCPVARGPSSPIVLVDSCCPHLQLPSSWASLFLCLRALSSTRASCSACLWSSPKCWGFVPPSRVLDQQEILLMGKYPNFPSPEWDSFLEGSLWYLEGSQRTRLNGHSKVNDTFIAFSSFLVSFSILPHSWFPE